MTHLVDAPSRQAALLLHSLADVDRQWVLSALAVEQQIALRSLLQELHDLGIPDDKQLVASLLPKPRATGKLDTASHTQLGGTGGEAPDLKELNPKEIQALARLLNRESPGFVAKVLHLREWAWTEVLLNQLNLSQQQRVRAKLDALKREAAHVFESAVPLALEKAVRQVLIAAIYESRQHEKNVNALNPSIWQHWRTIGSRMRNYVQNRIAIYVGRAA